MRTLLLLVLLAPCAFGQSRGWFLMPLVNGNIQADSLTYETGDTLNPVAGGFSIAHLNWKDSTALVLVHTSPARITALGKRFKFLGADTVAVKDSVVVKDGKPIPLINTETKSTLLAKPTLQNVLDCYKIPCVTLSKVSIGVKAKFVEKPVDIKPVELTK